MALKLTVYGENEIKVSLRQTKCYRLLKKFLKFRYFFKKKKNDN